MPKTSEFSSQNDSTLRTAAIGLGYWGPNMLRIINDASASELVHVCDSDADLAASIGKRFDVDWSSDASSVFNDPSIDAVYIATPPSTHADLAKRALQSGKHVLVEKPITQDSTTSLELITIAAELHRTLMVGHTFLYSPPVLKVKELIVNGTVGEIFYIESQRVNLGKFQKSGVMWDLAPHDLSIILHWLGETPRGVSATGRSFRSGSSEDVVFITLDFPSGALAQIHVSWLAPTKLRRTTISGSQKMVVYDDNAGPEAVKVFNHGVDREAPQTFGEFQLSYRQGDIWLPRLDTTEPLRAEWADFATCVRSGETPTSSGSLGLEVVRIMEAAQLSLAQNQRVEIGMPKPTVTPRPRFGVEHDSGAQHTSVS